MSKEYKVTEFSKLTQVGVRTLHYYDKVGLLNPSSRSESGYRYYTEEDAFKLARISVLKILGYSLKEIKLLIEKSDLDIIKALELQNKILQSHIAQLQQALKASQRLQDMFNQDQRIRWDVIMHITRLTTFKGLEEQTFYAMYFTEEEIKQMETVRARRTQKQQQELMQRWKSLLDEIYSNIESDPLGEQGQHYAKRYVDLFKETYQEYPKIGMKIDNLSKSGVIIESLEYLYHPGVTEYLETAVTHYCEKNKIDLYGLHT